MIIWDDLKQKAVITLEFRSQVHRVRFSRSKIVVALQNSVHIYAFSSPPEKLSVFETADNLFGLCCLGSRVIAFPGRTPGQVQLVEVETGNVSIIPAHQSPLQALELSPDGNTLASASETVPILRMPLVATSDLVQGTLIKIFSANNCSRIAELRRGVDHATIFSLKVSPHNRLLAVTSDKATLHIFDLPPTAAASSSSTRSFGLSSISSLSASDGGLPNQKWGIVGRIPFLPRVFSDIYSFASAPFELGDDPAPGGAGASGSNATPIPGVPGGRPAKGTVGWLDETTLLVVGAGRNGRWEKFVLGTGEEGRRFCVRQGWKRYLGT